jgi:hypothetical protein
MPKSNKNMSKSNKILIILIAVLIVALGAVVFWKKIGFEKPYWAVYTDTGDLYFGKISHFPKFSLTDVWFLQKTQDEKNPLSVAKFKQVFWSPEDNLYINEKNVVWKAKLTADSPVVKFIKNPQSGQQTGQTEQPTGQSQQTEPNVQPETNNQ